MPIGGVYGGYVNVSDVISAAAQAKVLLEVDKVIALIPNPALAKSAPHTDFDEIHPETARKLRAELAALKVAIDAAPTV